MRRAYGERSPRVGKRTMTFVTMALTIAFAAVVTSPALAAPKGILATFADCPYTTPGVELCLNSQTTSGEVKIGSTAVPINKTITLQGGAFPTGNPENPQEYFLIPAKDGNSLSKTELNVPGGLLGFINCTDIKGEGFFEKGARAACKAVFENKVTGVTATTELAATPSNPAILNFASVILNEGTALTLPVKVHLSNPFLGSECYIGSEAHPIQLHLTDGTTSPPLPNKPISGKLGNVEGEEEVQGGELVSLLKLTENSLVDNAFSAPVAEGCGGIFSFLIDPILNGKIGLPSKAGHNTAILTGTLRAASSEEVARHS